MPRTSRRQAFLLPSSGRHPFTAVFQDNREYSYFLYFQEEASLDISSLFDQSLFNHVIIQSSWTEPSLCQLVAALGALHKAGSPKALALPKEETDPHRQYAFQQYGRALKSVQTRITANNFQDTTRVALNSSLLIYCFEILYGDLNLALKHLESALRLMQTQLRRARRRYAHSKNSSPTPNLDDDLVAAFFRLDSGLLSSDSIKAESIGSRLGTNHLEDMCEIPQRFNTLSEARNYLETIQFPAIPDLSNDLVRINDPSSPKDIDEKARDVYTTMCSGLQQWNAAFAPLYAASFTPNGKNDSIAAATLRVRALSTEIVSRRVCARGPISPSFLNLECRELVDLSKLVASDPSFLKSFILDCGIVPGLSIVVAASIDMSIRKEALQILKDIVPRREGAWDSSTAVVFGERCLRMSGDCWMD